MGHASIGRKLGSVWGRPAIAWPCLLRTPAPSSRGSGVLSPANKHTTRGSVQGVSRWDSVLGLTKAGAACLSACLSVCLSDCPLSLSLSPSCTHLSLLSLWLPRVLSGLSSFVPELEAAENPLGTSLKQVSCLQVSDSGSGWGLSAASPASSGSCSWTTLWEFLALLLHLLTRRGSSCLVFGACEESRQRAEQRWYQGFPRRAQRTDRHRAVPNLEQLTFPQAGT